MKQKVKDSYPASFEDIESTIRRTEKMQAYVKEYQQKLKDEGAECQRICLVGHSFNFKFWTGEWDDPSTKYKQLPDKAFILKNVEMWADAKNYPLEQ